MLVVVTCSGQPPRRGCTVTVLFTGQRSGPIFPPVTIVHYDYRPKRARKQKPAVELPCGRIVSARKPKPRHYGEIRYGVPDEAQRTELVR
jgi:hypothetical protein